MSDAVCRCQAGWTDYRDFDERAVGVNRQHGRFGEVTVLRCRHCGRHWLHYLTEQEAVTGSGRWWRGPVSPAVAAEVTPETALATLAALPFYFVGGSFFGRNIYRAHGPIADL